MCHWQSFLWDKFWNSFFLKKNSWCINFLFVKSGHTFPPTPRHRNSWKPSRAIIILFFITFTLQPSTGCSDLISSGTPRASGIGGCCSRVECEPSQRILGVSVSCAGYSFSMAEAPHAQRGWLTGLRRNPSYAHYPRSLGHLDPQINDQWEKSIC